MHCPQCQHENREGAKFCEACGSKLEFSCPACGNQVRPGAAFCDKCGTALTGIQKGKGGKGEKGKRSEKRQSLRRLDSRLIDPRLAAAERRQLTVMFCDLVDSTALSAQMDPEEWRAVVQAYQAASAEVIH